jgi:hypothetical protein
VWSVVVPDLTWMHCLHGVFHGVAGDGVPASMDGGASRQAQGGMQDTSLGNALLAIGPGTWGRRTVHVAGEMSGCLVALQVPPTRDQEGCRCSRHGGLSSWERLTVGGGARLRTDGTFSGSASLRH